MLSICHHGFSQFADTIVIESRYWIPDYGGTTEAYMVKDQRRVTGPVINQTRDEPVLLVLGHR